MSQRILVFENDAAFADELKTSFERLGAVVQVAPDGPTGLELAASNRPDLILLTIELPGMNGFLVCKKIKKTAELETVPLVILSSEVDEETFEQHKKLRTRADEYIRKPIEFSELLHRVRPLIQLADDADFEEADEHADAIAMDDDELIVLGDDGTDLDAATADTDVSHVPESLAPGIALPPEEIHASSSVEDAGHRVASVAPPPLTPIPPQHTGPNAFASPPVMNSSVGMSYGGASTHGMNGNGGGSLGASVSAGGGMGLASVGGGVSPVARESARESTQNVAELERLRREIANAEEKTQAAERRAASAEQRATAADKALDAAKRTGGVSSRELLDMREQLNRKERELLDLREQVTQRDKQIIESSERSLGVERDLQDSRDKIIEIQRELEKKNEVVSALTVDKDNAKKRFDDVKGRLDRNEAKLREVTTENDDLKARHAAEVEGLRQRSASTEESLKSEHAAQVARLVHEHTSASERAAQEHKNALESADTESKRAAEAARQEHARAIEAAQQDHQRTQDVARAEHTNLIERLKSEHVAVSDSLRRAHDEELRELREEHAMTLKAANESAEQDRRHAVESLRSELTSSHDSKQRELVSAHEAERERITRKHQTETAEQTDKHRQDLARLGRALSEAEAQKVLLEEKVEETEASREALDRDLKSMTAERDQQIARVVALHGETEKLKGKISRDDEALARVQKALAIGLGLLEERKNDSV